MRFVALFLAVVVFSGFALADAPSVSSTTNPPGKFSGSPSIIMNVSYPGATAYIYSSDKNTNTVPDEATATLSKSGNISLGMKADGIYYFHVRAKAASGLSDTAHYELKIDTSIPGRPESPVGTALEDGTALVEWKAPSLPDFSGIASYNVYRSPVKLIKDGDIFREFTIRDAVVKKIANVTETKYLDKNVAVGAGRAYFYKLQAIDNAGNSGNPSVAATVRTLSLCDLIVSISTALVDSNLSVTVKANGKFFKANITIFSPEKTPTVLIESLSGVTDANASHVFAPGAFGDYNLFIASKDGDGDICNSQKTITYDTVKPAVKILSPQPTQPLSNIVHFEISAQDTGTNPSGIASVRLYLKTGKGETLLGNADRNGVTYSFDWNSMGAENGRFAIIARAFDKADNNADDVVTYNILNTFLQKSAAQTAIKSAEAKKQDALGYLKGLNAKNISVPGADAIFSAGDSNLAYAKSLVEKGQFLDISSKSASDAQAHYASILSKVSQEVYGSVPYAYNEIQLKVFLGASGIDASQFGDAEALIKKFSPSRHLEVLKVTRDGNKVVYAANIVISLSSPDRNSASLDIVEVIPKKFTDDASRISSNAQFEVLQKDPAIIFRGVTIGLNGDKNSASSGKVEIVYSLKHDLTKEQADALLASRVMDSFGSPPVLLPASSKVSYNTSPSSMPGLPSIDFGDKKTLIIIAVIVILLMLFGLAVVAAIVAWYFFFRKKKGSH